MAEKKEDPGKNDDKKGFVVSVYIGVPKIENVGQYVQSAYIWFKGITDGVTSPANSHPPLRSVKKLAPYSAKNSQETTNKSEKVGDENLVDVKTGQSSKETIGKGPAPVMKDSWTDMANMTSPGKTSIQKTSRTNSDTNLDTKKEEEMKKIEFEKKHVEEAKKREDERKKVEEARKKAEELKKKAEEEKRKVEEEKKKAEELQKKKKLEDVKKKVEASPKKASKTDTLTSDNVSNIQFSFLNQLQQMEDERNKAFVVPDKDYFGGREGAKPVHKPNSWRMLKQETEKPIVGLLAGLIGKKKDDGVSSPKK